MYVSRRGLENALDELKEQRIGCEVFGRPADYSPAEDNIVRVEAGLLRKRLTAYFNAEGRDERLLLSIPKGSYVPVFEERDTSATDPASPATAENRAVPVHVERPAGTLRSLKFWIGVAAILGVACVGLTVALAHRTARIETAVPAHITSTTTRFWNNIFTVKNRTYLVCADAGLALFQDLTHQHISLADYLNRAYEQRRCSSNASAEASGTSALIRSLPEKQYTSIADMYIMARLLRLGNGNADHVLVRATRSLSLEDFKSNNFVLLGSPRANPWTELFKPELNFVWEYPPNSNPVIRNKHSKAGEQRSYSSEGRGYNATTAYSVVVFLPNLSHSGNVLVIAGTSLIGTEAAGEYITTGDGLERFLHSLKLTQGSSTPYFEMLIRSSALAGGPETSELVAYRIHES